MKIIQILCILAMLFAGNIHAQSPPEPFAQPLMKDDSAGLAKVITKENINSCMGNYSLLSFAVRAKAIKCVQLLIDKGADVNKSCSGYVPPLMHAAKYAPLDLVKLLVKNGAKLDYKYEGSYTYAQGMTPRMYAEANKRIEVAEYLKSLENKQ